MRTTDFDILIVPGLGGSGPDHWQSRWEAKLSTARRIEQADWLKPRLDAWTGRIVEAVGQASRPVLLVAHSLGVPAIIHAAPRLAGVSFYVPWRGRAAARGRRRGHDVSG